MSDVAPELYKKIKNEFETRMSVDPFIRKFRKKLEDEKASAEDVSNYARRVGECASAAMTSVLKEENLPDGRLYWNIADRTIKPIFIEAHKLINEAAAAVQMVEDRKLGINLKPIEAGFPEERVHALINKLVNEIEALGDEDGED